MRVYGLRVNAHRIGNPVGWALCAHVDAEIEISCPCMELKQRGRSHYPDLEYHLADISRANQGRMRILREKNAEMLRPAM